MNITNTEYWKEVRSLAANIIEECKEYDYLDIDGYLHETIDGHQWVIYYAYNLDVLQHSDNAEYMADNVGGLDDSLKQGLDTLHMHLAYWALYADVYEAIITQQAIDS